VLNVFVICTPGSTRAVPLLEQLEFNPRVSLHKMTATMISEMSTVSHEGLRVNTALARVIYGRDLLPGEIGCAISHNIARKSISSLPSGGLVFEDDARISDVESLISDSIKFLEQSADSAKVLSFFTGDSSVGTYSSQGEKIKWSRALGSTPYALAYAITARGARLLYDSNSPVKFVADWPVAAVKFYSSNKKYVRHGEINLPSTIEHNSDLRKRPRTFLRVQIFTGLYYFTNFRQVGNFRNYLEWMWLPRVFFHVQKLTGILKIEMKN
jgi:hypothetical protein